MIFLPMSITSQPSRSCHRRSGRTGTASSFPGCSGRRSGCSWTCCRILGTICPTEMVLYNLEMASQTECNWGNELVRFGRKRSDREETVRSGGNGPIGKKIFLNLAVTKSNFVSYDRCFFPTPASLVLLGHLYLCKFKGPRQFFRGYCVKKKERESAFEIELNYLSQDRFQAFVKDRV